MRYNHLVILDEPTLKMLTIEKVVLVRRTFFCLIGRDVGT